MRWRNTIAFGLILVLVCTLAGVSGHGSENSRTLNIQTSLAERVDHEPIIIDGNADMLAQKSENNWTGTGESGSPIMIVNYLIESYDQGITIRNVNLFFVIDNCEVADIDSQYYASTGIKLDNCIHGSISNSVVHMKETGIFIRYSSSITVTGNAVHDCSAGISVEGCNSVNINNNNFGWNDFVGVNITGSSSCTIYENSILSIPYFGIMCIVDTNTFLSGNIITSTDLENEEIDHVGILSFYSTNFAMHNTTISDCSINLEMQETDGSWIWDCCFLAATEYGIYLHDDTYNVTIVENCIIPSGGITAYDGGESNSWDDSYSEIGNWWSDWSGTGYYYISGPAESIDHFPNRFACNCGDGNYTVVSITDLTTTSNTTGFGGGVEPLVLIIAIGSSAVILIVVILIFRSNKPY